MNDKDYMALQMGNVKRQIKDLSIRQKPTRSYAECQTILLNAGFNHTQIDALLKVGAIKP